MLANREGLFHAYPVNTGISESGANKLATCVMNFHLFQELANGEWQDIREEKLDITGYFYLEKKDGGLNTVTIDALKAALDWDGRDPFWLQDTDLSGHPVQVKLAFEEFKGKKRLKVQFINPFGSSSGAVKKADDQLRRSVGTRMGAKFRALAGPATPTPKVPVPPTPAARTTTPKATMDEAWAVFIKTCKPDRPQAEVEAEWFRILGELFPGRELESLTPEEWARVAAEAPSRILPF